MSKLYADITPSEREYQDKVIDWFKNIGYTYLGNYMYAKNASQRSDGKNNAPIIEERLVAFLMDKMGCGDFQVQQVLNELKQKAYLSDKRDRTLSQTNCDLYSTAFTFPIKAKPSKDKPEEDIYLFDFKNFENNDFAIAEEVSYIDQLTGKGCRPDLVVYVNGIALAVIELKSCMVNMEEAIRQNLSNEMDLIPSFFTTTQFTIAASQGLGFKYGTILTPMKFWCYWKNDSHDVGKILTDEEAFKSFFDKTNFMLLFRYGVICDGGTKKVMRPHQLHALVAAQPRLEKKQSGVIWHSQGSGKSLTMIWLAAYIKANFTNPRIIVLTDRTELDIQINNGFCNAGESPVRATSGDELLEYLNNSENSIICSLIHKFGKSSDENSAEKEEIKIRLDKYLEELRAIIKQKYPKGFSVKGDNIFVFIDECHRTQGGKLHEAMREILGKDVMLIGFTGTPLLKQQKKNEFKDFAKTSEVKFGTFIHKYLHKEAIDDKVILDLRYEARDVEQTISSKDKLDRKKDEITKGLSDERKRMVEDRWATLEKVYSSKERIERIGYSIIDDVETQMLKHDWCNAILVAGDVYSAYKYYEFFQNICTNKTLQNRCAVVTSYNPSDNDLRKEAVSTEAESRNQFKYKMAKQSYDDAGIEQCTAEKYEKWAKKLFTKQPAQMKLLIVVDKLLTGFDAPTATYLYIDKQMKDHTLFQALCRVNRLGVDVKDIDGNTIISNKEYGLIVDFKHLFGNITDAITKFNDENGGLGNFDPEDIEDLLQDAIDKNKKVLEERIQAYEDLKSEWNSCGVWSEDRDKRLALLANYYISRQNETEARELRLTMYKITGNLVAGYDNIADYMGQAGFSKADTDRIEFLVKEASCINRYIKQQSGDDFDAHNYDAQMRALLDQYIRAEDAEVIVPATAEFSFLDLIDNNLSSKEVYDATIRKTGSSKSAASIIEGNARCVINSYKEKDPILFQNFSDRLEELLKLIKDNTNVFIEEILKIIDLIKEAKSGGVSYPEGINTNLAKALWNNYMEWDSANTDENLRVETITKIENCIEEDAYDQWRDAASPDGINFVITLTKLLNDKTADEIQTIYKFARQNTNE